MARDQMNITNEAVEAAAARLLHRLAGKSMPEATATEVAMFTEDARAALEAAAPHMLAGAWDEGKRACDREWEQTADIVTPDEDRYIGTNPYRPTP